MPSLCVHFIQNKHPDSGGKHTLLPQKAPSLPAPRTDASQHPDISSLPLWILLGSQAKNRNLPPQSQQTENNPDRKINTFSGTAAPLGPRCPRGPFGEGRSIGSASPPSPPAPHGERGPQGLEQMVSTLTGCKQLRRAARGIGYCLRASRFWKGRSLPANSSAAAPPRVSHPSSKHLHRAPTALRVPAHHFFHPAKGKANLFTCPPLTQLERGRSDTKTTPSLLFQHSPCTHFGGISSPFSPFFGANLPRSTSSLAEALRNIILAQRHGRNDHI